MSDDEGDVVVMRVCAGAECDELYGLQFDENIGESFCPRCLSKLREAEELNDFRMLLSPDDRRAVALIFAKFDVAKQSYWTFEEYNAYAAATSSLTHEQPHFSSNEEMAGYIEEEYAVACVDHIGANGTCTANVVTLEVLEKIYGGYMYHGINALRDDFDALQDEVNFDVLE